MPDRRRVAVVVLLVLVVVALAFAADVLDLGSLRLGGVSLLWWYAGLVAPVLAALAAALALLGERDP